MTIEERKAWLKKMREKPKKAAKQSKFKKSLKRELQLKPDQSIAEAFPDNFLKLKGEILARLPQSDPRRERYAEGVAKYMMGDAAGKIDKEIGVNYSKIHQIMDVVFPDPKEMVKVLENTLLNNAVLANAIFLSKAHELSPKDAAVAAGIFAQRFLELKKDREGTDQQPIDLKLIVQLQGTLGQIHQLKQLDNSKVIELPPNEKAN